MHEKQNVILHVEKKRERESDKLSNNEVHFILYLSYFEVFCFGNKVY